MDYINHHYKTVDITALHKQATLMLQEAGFNPIDYIDIADAENLAPIEALDTYNHKMVVLIAAYLNGIRLIDNMNLS